jgi:hypothetical protein
VVKVLMCAMFCFVSISRRLPAWVLRQRLLWATPIGTTMTDVDKYVAAEKWKVQYVCTTHGYTKEEETHRVVVGEKSIRADLGQYQGFPFVRYVTVYWGFDKQARLVDIWVWKTSDAM